jgi:hypothetical protein
MMAKPGTGDSKQWEQIIPRFAKGIAKAYRYGVYPQAEVTQTGAKIVKFDPSDPDDLVTVAAQALGFTPTKVSETWEALRQAREEHEQYKARRMMLYVQYDKALKDQNQDAITDVVKAIQKYNDQVRSVDPNMQISARQLRQSLIQRMRGRAMQEQLGTSQKQAIPLTRRIMELYPAVQERLGR